MTLNIILSVILGIGAGYFVMPDSFIATSDTVMTIGLCALLFFVGIDIGKNKDAFLQLKKMGFKILWVPVLIGLGSIVGGIIGGSLIGMNFKESAAVSAGFGWYSLSAVIIAEHSAQLGALAFIANVVRELTAIIITPIVGKYIGAVETVAPAGATAMDTLLPIVSKSAGARTEVSIISFISGIVLSLLVPVLVPIIMAL